MNDIYTEIILYAKMMWRYRWISLAVAWTISIIGWIIVLSLPDKFQSEARIYVDTGSLLAPLLKGISVVTDVDQEIMIMQRTLLSRPNMEQVMRMNDMDLATNDSTDVEGIINNLASKITVTAQTKNLFNIAYSHTNPQVAQSVVQSVLTIFVENNLGQSRTDMEAARGFIEKQIADYERQLQAAEQRRAEFMAKNNQFLSQGTFSAKLTKGMDDLRSTKIALQDAEIRRDELSRQLSSIPERVQASDALQILASQQGGNTLSGRIATAEQNLDNLKLQYTEKHPDVLALQRLIGALKAQRDKEAPAGTSGGISNPLYENVKIMLIETETNVAGLQRAVTEAERVIEENRILSENAPRIEAELSDLDRDYSVLKGNYEELLARREAAKISQAQEASTSSVQFRVIDPPRLPAVATSPQRPVLYFLSLLIGLGAGGGIAFLLATFSDSFVTTSQLTNGLNLPVLGRVSIIRTVADQLRLRKENWRFGLASGGLMASTALVWLAGPRLVKLMNTLGGDAISSMFGGAV